MKNEMKSERVMKGTKNTNESLQGNSVIRKLEKHSAHHPNAIKFVS